MAHIRSSRSRVAALVVSLIGAVAVTAGLPASAQSEQEPTDTSVSVAELMQDSTSLHPDVIAYAPFAAAEVHALKAELRSAVARQEQAVLDRQSAQRERLVLAGELGANRAAQMRWERTVEERTVLVAEAQDRLRSLAVESFVSDDALELELDALLGHNHPTLTLNIAAEGALHSDVLAATAQLSQAEAMVAGLQLERATLEATMPQIDDRWADADSREGSAAADIERLKPELEDATMLARVSGVGFPAVVLDAYYRAALATNARYPACNLGWNQLAGIGQVETHHGTYGGSTVQSDGAVEPQILGIVLDGTRSSAIRDTDGGAMDGNAVWDRAVGPMQFIPGSWKIFGSDGNGDGIEDPHNLYDAAAAAGEHLCRSHSGLHDAASFRVALLGYNRSTEYGTKVMSYARAYGASITLNRPAIPDPVEEVPVVIAFTDGESPAKVATQE